MLCTVFSSPLNATSPSPDAGVGTCHEKALIVILGEKGRGRNAQPTKGLVEETKDLAGNVLSPGLLVVHDTSRGGEDNVAERTGREQLADPVLDLAKGNVVAGRDDTALVDTAVELDDNLAGTVVVNDLKLANVT